MSDPAPNSQRWRPRAGVVLAAVLALHLALVINFAPPHVIFGEVPIGDIDYPLHFHQVTRALQAFTGWSRLWGYDPLVLAGQPAGALEDISTKSLELFVIALNALRVGPAQAFNLYVLLVHLLVPLLGYLSSRLFRLSRWQATIATGLWVLLWYFDSLLHWLWFCGMVSWAAVSALAVLLVALLYRILDNHHRDSVESTPHLQGREEQVPEQEPLGPDPAASVAAGSLGLAWRWLTVAALASLLALMHPFAALTLIAPCAALYLRDLRRLSWRWHAALWLSGAAALAASLVWLLPALSLRHYLLDEETFLRPTLDYLLYDFLDLMRDDLQTGAPVRTMLRVLCLAAALFCLVQWRRRRDRRFLPLATLIGAALLISYAGGHIALLRKTQPYRQMGPATLAAAIPAAVLLSWLLKPSHFRRAARPIKVLLILALVLLSPRLIRSLLFYFPQVMPPKIPRVDNPNVPRPAMLAGFVEHPPWPLQHHVTSPVVKEVRQYLEESLADRPGRVVVQEYMLAESLAGSSSLPILGGLEQRAIHHADAHLFRRRKDGNLPGGELEAYFERYAVRFVVVSHLRRSLEWRKELLTFRRLIGPIRVYETRIRPNYLMRGQGRVVDQSFNRIRVTGARGAEVVLRFHWMETLRCRPGCTVERFPIKEDRVGFIRVANPPPRFEIYNSYSFD